MSKSTTAPGGFECGPSPNVSSNGRDGKKPFTDEPDPSIPLAIVRLIHRRQVAPKTRSTLPAEWADLAEFVESSTGLEPDQLWPKVQEWVDGRCCRHPEFRAGSKALDTAWKAAAESDPGDEPDSLKDRPPFSLAVIDSATFFATEHKLDWLVHRVLIAEQPCIIGGPKKTLKTSVLIDLAVSLATAKPFLGEFLVDRPVKVGFFSGESGPATVKDTAVRICKSKGMEPSELGNIFWGFRLPQLSQPDQLDELARTIRERGLKVVIIDPLYLCLLSGSPGRRLDASNLFDMGPLLSTVTETCLQAGATPLLVHHFKKNRESPLDTPELEDLAFAGIQEFARQWLLIGRREKFKPGSGIHRLWLTVGGSAGHSGDWALDVDEGIMDVAFQGRRWGVTIRSASDVRTEVKERSQSAKAERDTEKAKTRAEAKDREDADAVVVLLDHLRGEPDRKATIRRIRDLTGWRSEKAGHIFARAEKQGFVRPAKVTVLVGTSKTKEYPGYEHVKDIGEVEPCPQPRYARYATSVRCRRTGPGKAGTRYGFSPLGEPVPDRTFAPVLAARKCNSGQTYRTVPDFGRRSHECTRRLRRAPPVDRPAPIRCIRPRSPLGRWPLALPHPRWEASELRDFRRPLEMLVVRRDRGRVRLPGPPRGDHGRRSRRPPRLVRVIQPGRRPPRRTTRNDAEIRIRCDDRDRAPRYTRAGRRPHK